MVQVDPADSLTPALHSIDVIHCQSIAYVPGLWGARGEMKSWIWFLHKTSVLVIYSSKLLTGHRHLCSHVFRCMDGDKWDGPSFTPQWACNTTEFSLKKTLRTNHREQWGVTDPPTTADCQQKATFLKMTDKLISLAGCHSESIANTQPASQVGSPWDNRTGWLGVKH